jgi:hypothetical protein
MRSGAAGWLIGLNVLLLVALALLIVQTVQLRGDLNAAREELTDMRTTVTELERGVPVSEVALRFDAVERELRQLALVVGTPDPTSAPGASPGAAESDGSEGGDGASSAAVVAQLEEVLDAIEALDNRVDEICRNVPVC